MSFIEVEHLCKSFVSGGQETPVLKDLDLAIEEGEMALIMGPSGCGKTTLLNLIGGIDRPDSGTVRVGSVQVDSLSETGLLGYRRDLVGFVFQFYNLIPTLTALENVVLGQEVRGRAGKEEVAQAREYLEAVGLCDRADHFPQQLSAGQQQRVAIARALVKRPRIVLADEPTGNLDEGQAAMVMDLMKGLQEREGVTFIIVSHNQEMRQRTDRALYLRHGRIEG